MTVGAIGEQVSGRGPAAADTGAAVPAREQAFLFYTLASSSFIESAIETYVENLSALYEGDPDTVGWLREQWLSDETRHGELMNRYVRANWPEFRWDEAYADFHGRIPRGTVDHMRGSRALEALSRCVVETYTAMMYRCIASYTDDRELRDTLDGMSSDEVRHFGVFRQIFHRYDAGERNRIWSKVGTLLGRTEKLRGNDLAVLFDILNGYWSAPPPFAVQSFAEFRETAKPIVLRHFPIDAAQRMLFSPLGLRSSWERIARWAVTRFLVQRNLGSLPEADAARA